MNTLLAVKVSVKQLQQLENSLDDVIRLHNEELEEERRANVVTTATGRAAKLTMSNYVRMLISQGFEVLGDNPKQVLDYLGENGLTRGRKAS